MKVTVKLDSAAIKRITDAAKEAALDTMDALYTDLANSKTMPFDTGNMQNGGTYASGVTVEGNTVVDFSEGNEIHVCLTNDAPQARRLYYHPEYNFKQSEGANGTRGAYWLEPYISGDKKDFIMQKYTEIFRRRAGL